MHTVIEPNVLYFGTPVVLISTLNEDGTPNLAPMSSAWWLNDVCMLGMSTRSKTVENMKRERECVLNLPSADMVAAVDRLALTTGRNPVPERKAAQGYRYEPDKFGVAGLTAIPSDLVKAPRALECPVQLEARVTNIRHLGDEESSLAGIEAVVTRVHIEESLLMEGHTHYIDPEKWNPLIMNFCEFFGLSGKLYPSRLAPLFGPPQTSVLERG